jgi:hypothetical protein
MDRKEERRRKERDDACVSKGNLTYSSGFYLPPLKARMLGVWK